MGASAESVSLEKEAPSRRSETGVQQAATALSGTFDPFLERLFGGAPVEPPESAAISLSVQRLKVPVLQRSQRLYGNHASQQIVMRSRALQRQCMCGGTCTKCQEEEEQRALQLRPSAHSVREFDGIPTTHGEPIDAATRRPLEAHFGADLADVRVHTGSEAAESATSLDALAYTSGRDIYFAAGMYAPASDSGRRLLAHEVAHVVQQGSGKEPAIATKSSRGVKIGAPDDSLEMDAERAAGEFMFGTPGELSDEEQRRRRESGVAVQTFIQRQGGSPHARQPGHPPGASDPQTLSRDTYSDAGRYNPSGLDGRRLLAHELAHTMQQRGAQALSPAEWVPVGIREDPEGWEAERAADAVASGEKPAVVFSTVHATVQRQTPGGAPPPAPAPAPSPTPEDAGTSAPATIWVNDVTLTANRTENRRELEQLYVEKGSDAVEDVLTQVRREVGKVSAEKSDQKRRNARVSGADRERGQALSSAGFRRRRMG